MMSLRVFLDACYDRGVSFFWPRSFLDDGASLTPKSLEAEAVFGFFCPFFCNDSRCVPINRSFMGLFIRFSWRFRFSPKSVFFFWERVVLSSQIQEPQKRKKKWCTPLS